MRRAPFVLAATAAGLVGVLSYHVRPGRAAAGGLTPGTASPATTSPPTTSSPRPGRRTTAPQGTTVPRRAKRPATSVPAHPGSAGAATVTGAAEQYGYGTMAVSVTTRAGRITDVRVASLRTADTYSQQLADQVIPHLRREVLSAQGTHVYGISGATYTSEAYAASVQSALDKLHFHR